LPRQRCGQAPGSGIIASGCSVIRKFYVLSPPAMGIFLSPRSSPTIRASRFGVYKSCYFGADPWFPLLHLWAHHMYLTGMVTRVATFFQTTTLHHPSRSIVDPSDLHVPVALGRANSLQHPRCCSHGILPMFGIGGLTGLPLDLTTQRPPPARHLHLSRTVHYRCARDKSVALFAGGLLLVPKMTAA